MKKVKVKANAMEEADVSFISLVGRPANRIPFRVTKSEDSPEEGNGMINFLNVFKQDGNKGQPVGCSLAAVVLQKQHVEHFTPILKEMGLVVDDIVEQDGVVILRQEAYEDADVTMVKLNEMAGLFTNVPEEVQKGFDPFPESEDFAENLQTSGFLPGVSIATEVLMDTVRNILRAADSPETAKEGLGVAIDAYRTHLTGLMGDLPEVAFKMEAMTLEGFEAEDVTKSDDKVTDNADDNADDKVDAAKSDDKPNNDGADGADDAGDETAKKADDGLSDTEREALKGVHLEGAEDESDKETAKKAEAKTDEKVDDADDKSEKSKGESSEILLAIGAIKTEVLGAVEVLRGEVTELKDSQGKLTEQVSKAEETATKAHEAVKGTVPSYSDAGDAIPNESIGSSRSKAEKADDTLWGGTALDNIVGDVKSH